jgi:hypothetical protein
MKTVLLSRKNWSDRVDFTIRTMSPEMAAEKLGLPVAAIKARRVELGLGPFVARRWGSHENAKPIKPR